MPQSIPNSDATPIQARVQRAIAEASNRTGIDFDYLFSQARLESNFNPSARARTSSASGLYQFTKQTWLNTVKLHGTKHGLGWAANAISQNSKGYSFVSDREQRAEILALRNNPEIAAVMAAEFAADNRKHLVEQTGRQPEEVDLYLAHFLGAGGASRFLKAMDSNPAQPAATLFPKAAAANRSVFYEKSGKARSLSELRSSFQTKLDADNHKTPRMMARNTVLPAPVPAFARSDLHASPEETNPRPLEMMGFQKMPEKLSLEFARNTYARLAAMGGPSR